MSNSRSTENVSGSHSFNAYPDEDLKELVPEFLNNRRLEIPILEGFLAKNDLESIRRIGHTLKGVCASFGFPPLGDLGAQLEAMGPDAADEARELINQIKNYVENVQVIYRGSE